MDQRLVCSEDEDIFLFVTPPRSVLHEARTHRTIQCQRTLRAHQGQPGQHLAPVRIRPVLNLEATKRGATRIIELESDDQRIAELQPARMPAGTETAASNGGLSPVEYLPRRRSRGRSIGERRGAFGGDVASTPAFAHRFDMRVSGSVQEGRFEFVSNNTTLTWHRREVAGHAEWVLQPNTSAGKLEQHRQNLANNMAGDGAQHNMLTPIATSTSFRPRNALSRINSNVSQFTMILDDESILSETLDANHAHFDPQRKQETVLSSTPVPHLRHWVGVERAFKTSMHAIAQKEDGLIMLLISALWIIWASNDIMALDEHGVSIEKEAHHGLAGQAYANREGRQTSFSLSDDLTSPVRKPREKAKKRGFWQRIASVC